MIITKTNRQTKTNIIILTYNKLDYTMTCIESIRANTQRGSYQMIVVDNCSTDGTREWLAEQSDIITIFNEENVGFPKGCNQGIKLTTSGDIMLLNNDVIVTENWLDILQDCLHSSDEVGAVGPTDNGVIDVNYGTVDELFDFARAYNNYDSSKWEKRLKLIGFAMLIKRSVVEEVGLIDERFSPGNCEDTDYSFRIIQRGYKIYYCNNVFLHHYGSVSFGEMEEQYSELLDTNRKKFVDKWGFHSQQHSKVRKDILSLINDREPSERLSILDVGCGCGATLLQLENLYPQARLYGIEKNGKAAAIASEVANVTTGNVEEELYYPGQYFDYILLGSVLEELEDPINTLISLKKHLKQDGEIIASISNPTYYKLIYSLLQGDWPFSSQDTSNRNPLRFFTLKDGFEMFVSSGLENIQYFPVERAMSREDSVLIDKLAGLNSDLDQEQLLSEQYLFKMKTSSKENSVKQKLCSISKGIEKETNLSEIISLIESDELNNEALIKDINTLDIDRQTLLNYLATSFFKHDLFNDIIPLLNASLEIDSTHQTTLFNYASILHSVGADALALQYLDRIEHKDAEYYLLLEKINADIK